MIVELETKEFEDIYNKEFDYDDMKVAICIKDFFDNFHKEMFFPLTFETMVEIAIEIRENYKRELEKKTLSKEEYSYIQEYAYRYLQERFMK